MANKLSLKSRLTFFVAIILILVTIILTTFSLIMIERLMVKPQIENIDILTFITRDGVIIDTILSNEDEIIYEIPIDEGIEDEIEEDTRRGGHHQGKGHQRRKNTRRKDHHLSKTDMDMIGKGRVVSNMKTAQNKVSKISILAMMGIIIFGIITVYIMIDRALRPLRDLSGSIHEIGEDNLNTQIEVPDTNDEISSLIVSFNRMLSRLELMFKEQKNFSAKAAHELKTPLTTMKTSLQVLQMDEDPPVEEYRENVGLMENNIDRLIETVNNLFLLSSDNIKLNDRVEVDGLIYRIIEEKREELEDKNISVKLSLAKLEVPGNFELLNSSISNIVENAIKYNKDSGMIKIKSYKKRNMACISVRDTGIGMTKDEIDHIFDAFYRVDGNRVEGNGLGLSIVKNIIDEHKGDIEVKSELGLGTEIILKIPI